MSSKVAYAPLETFMGRAAFERKMLKKCMNCGELFEGHPNRKYCSDKCIYQAKAKMNKPKAVARAIAWARANPEKRRRSRKKWLDKHPEYQKKSRQRNSESRKLHYQELRLRVLEIVGHGKLSCTRCPMKDIRLLEINHIYGNGKADHKNPVQLYRDIYYGRRSADDFEITCKICNIIHFVETKYPEYRGKLKLMYLQSEEVIIA